jgi:hypothetical protein
MARDCPIRWDDYTKQDHKGNRSSCDLRQEKQMEPTENTGREQFIEDYTLVIDNDQDSYNEIMEMPELLAGNMSGLSDKLRERFEEYVGQVVEREKENGQEAGALLISQMLMNWGAGTFDKIAKHYIGLKTEAEKVA